MTGINAPTGGDVGLKLRLLGLSPAEKDRLFEMLKQEREDKDKKQEKELPKHELFGNRDALLKNLKKYLKEDDAEMMGYKGKEVHFSLPAVGNFEGFKLDYFVSNDLVYGRAFEANPELEKKSKSMKQIGEILKAVNRYMAELGVETDGDMDYENDLQYWKTEKYGCKAGGCLRDITGLDKYYWTSDKGVDGRKNSRVGWFCNGGLCYFGRFSYDDDCANLFLGLSDRCK